VSKYSSYELTGRTGGQTGRQTDRQRKVLRVCDSKNSFIALFCVLGPIQFLLFQSAPWEPFSTTALLKPCSSFHFVFANLIMNITIYGQATQHGLHINSSDISEQHPWGPLQSLRLSSTVPVRPPTLGLRVRCTACLGTCFLCMHCRRGESCTEEGEDQYSFQISDWRFLPQFFQIYIMSNQ
jgi:hypothetical protein